MAEQSEVGTRVRTLIACGVLARGALACGSGAGAGESAAEDAVESAGEGADAGSEANAAENAGEGADEDVEREAERAADPALNEPITVGLAQLPRKFDPLGDMEPWAMRIADDLVFEGLVRRSGDRYPWVEPAIADRCEVDREYAVATVTCHVPAGIRFHDGSELTMADVEYSLDYWLDPRRSWSRERNGLPTFDRVEIVDGPRGAPASERDPGRWVQLGFDKREPLALEALAAIKIVPVSAHRGRESRFAQDPVGTGPMAITTLEADRVILERFEDFHEPARAVPSGKLIFRAIDDGAEALTALRRGEIQLLPEVAPVHVPVELGKPGMAGRFQAWLVSPARYDLLMWNVGKGLSGELGIRSALHDAVPYSAIARNVYRAPGLPVEAPVDLHEPTPIDLDALADIKAGEAVRGGLLEMPALDDDARAALGAAAALDALGWPPEVQGYRRRPNGPLRVILTNDGQDGRAAQLSAMVRGAWESIGVRAPHGAVPWRFMTGTLRKGEYRVAMLHLAGYSDEDLFHLFHSRGALNLAGVADEQLDTALSDYRGAPDRAARDAAKQRVAQRIAELRVVSVLYAPAHVLLASRRLTGVEFVDDLPRLDTLALVPGDIDWGGG
ncbi:hypothetical protein G6O69_26950 [Pseudenhygromyxa sp. WMMC2535]|uniref:ABC transporter substrate-binding protein n=1 Tax=Pseudenhygromyxa sp. WMMC2535 TaxID=2712867 RepID=UPI0015546B01|nr:ABC transporter substrate-binding protein [Pseudenhygromyxa sp. WMMC2535]NVB41506.1 hypothetical protein [Pseudenhygromyxa sp. WMMC2535]